MSIPWNGNWKWKLDRYKKLLSHAFNKPDDSLFKWYYRLGRAVSNQAQSPCPRIFGEKSEIPTAKKKNSILLSRRPDLKARARVGKGWNKKWLKKLKGKGKKKKNNLSKDTLLPRNLSQLYKKALLQANSSARQLWELHTQQTTNLGSNHHLQCYFKKDLLKICKSKTILFIIYSLGMAKSTLLAQRRSHEAW